MDFRNGFSVYSPASSDTVRQLLTRSSPREKLMLRAAAAAYLQATLAGLMSGNRTIEAAGEAACSKTNDAFYEDELTETAAHASNFC